MIISYEAYFVISVYAQLMQSLETVGGLLDLYKFDVNTEQYFTVNGNFLYKISLNLL